MRQNRPFSVTAFELVNLIPIAWALIVTETASWFTELVASVILLTLTLWITRRRSQLGRAVYTSMIILALGALIAAYSLWLIPTNLQLPIALLFGAEAALLLVLLWWPTTTDWLKARHDAAAI